MTVNDSLDYETATSHDITVLATSTDGSTSSKSFTISVTDDVSDNNTDIGAVSDSDGTANQVQENSSVGASVGITASATDDDTADTVTYELSNDAGGLFKINGDGVVTVNGSLDYETATSHDITVLATSTDGSSSSKTFTLSVIDDASITLISPTKGSFWMAPYSQHYRRA